MAIRKRIEPDPSQQWDVASKGALVGETLYLSGQVGLGDDGEGVGDDIRSQAEQALKNIEAIVKAAGGTMRDVVHLTLFFTDRAHSGGYFEVAKQFFPEEPPCATGIVVSGLLIPELLLEIDAVAVLGSGT